MTHLNKPQIERTFDKIKQYLKSIVPPCTITVDTPDNFQIEAIKGDSKHIFAYAVAHEHVITVGFNEEIKCEEMKQIFPDTILKDMNEHNRIEIRQLQDTELRKDFQSTCESLMRFFEQKNWI